MSVAAMAWARRQKTGSPTMKAVLLAVADYADERGCAWPSQKRIAEDTELSVRAVRDALAALEAAGFISREPFIREDNSRGADRISLAINEAAAPSASLPARGTGGAAPRAGGVGNDVPGGAAGRSPLTTFEPSPEPPQEQIPAAAAPGLFASSPAAPKPRPRKPNARPDYHGDFEMLWAEFPRHPNSSKSEAYAAWLRLPVEDREPCFDGARLFAKRCAAERTEPRYIPHLVTWINQRRFDTILEAAE